MLYMADRSEGFTVRDDRLEEGAKIWKVDRRLFTYNDEEPRESN